MGNYKDAHQCVNENGHLKQILFLKNKFKLKILLTPKNKDNNLI